jgi:hypothetical protein
MGKLEISFNSPQCGWMSIGFADGESEFHTTTAHAPYEFALAELLLILSKLAHGAEFDDELLLKWNRDPEEFDFRFVREADVLTIEIYEYPDSDREDAGRQLVFTHTGTVNDICAAFAVTFARLYQDRNTDEFEFNWRQPFPYREYEAFANAIGRPEIAEGPELPGDVRVVNPHYGRTTPDGYSE